MPFTYCSQWWVWTMRGVFAIVFGLLFLLPADNLGERHRDVATPGSHVHAPPPRSEGQSLQGGRQRPAVDVVTQALHGMVVAGRQVARQIDSAKALKDDIGFLSERGERVADRLDALVRAARPLTAEAPRQVVAPNTQPEADLPGMSRVRSQAERDLLKALRMAR